MLTFVLNAVSSKIAPEDLIGAVERDGGSERGKLFACWIETIVLTREEGPLAMQVKEELAAVLTTARVSRESQVRLRR